MSKPATPNEPITIGERIATAFVSAIAAGLTLLGYFVLLLALASKSYAGPPRALFDLFLSKISLGFIATAFVIGFVLGSTRMATVFGSLWGTNEEEDEPWLIKLKVVIVVAIVVFAAAHFTRGW